MPDSYCPGSPLTLAIMDQEHAQPTCDSAAEATALLDVLGVPQGLAKSKTSKVNQSVNDVLAQLVNRITRNAHLSGYATGFDKLDRLTNGLKPGDMFVIASRPNMGKTTLMLNIVETVCIGQEVPTLIFSCRMTAFEIVQSILFSLAKFSLNELWFGYRLTKGELLRIRRAATTAASARLFVDDTACLTIDTLCAEARRRKDEDDIRFIAIDNLNILKPNLTHPQESRECEISQISASLKSLAKELSIPILVLAQLNHRPASRGDGRDIPHISDLRDCGSIEHDADMIALLHRPAHYAETEEERQALMHRADLILAQNRHGPTGHQSLDFFSDIGRFEDHSFEEEPLE